MAKFNPVQRHRMVWHGRCYACICRVCNLATCRYKTLWARCYACRTMHNTAIIDCDQFESRYIRKIYRIKREVFSKKNPSIHQMIRDIWKSGKWK